MQWTKIATLFLILVLFACVGFFGAKTGYSVHGIEYGGEVSGIGDMAGYLFSLGSFSIDNMPTEISTFFDILIIVFIYLIAATFIPFIPG